MKKIFVILSFLLVCNALSQQEKVIVEGKVSYFSSQNIYVKFLSTNGIKVGDTLFVKRDNTLNPILLVKYISSTSCSGLKITESKIEIGSKIIAIILHDDETYKPVVLSVSDNQKKIKPIKNSKNNKSKRTGGIDGRLSLSSYGNISNINSADYLRWRYTFSARAQNFRSSNFSFDSYISFNYRSTEWNYIKNNISDALKIYSLSINYQVSENINISIGRKVNRNISNIGAIDGVQLEGTFSSFKAGLLVGSRPDYLNYTYNLNFFEFGGFVSHSYNFGFGSMQNSFALFQQTNSFKTDRRFFYFQHSSSLINKVNLFLSSEVDLFKKENGIPQSSFSLTGLYLSLRYRPSRIISFQTSFDSRKNVIYYETFHNYADSLYDNATRQGVRFRVNIRPINNLYLNISYGYRYRTNDLKTTQNISASLSYSNIPFIAGSFGISYNNLVTSYLDGNVYGIRYSRDLLSGIIYGTLSARRINYNFANGTPNLEQIIISTDISWRILKQLSLSINYEGIFEDVNNYSRFYLNITKRF